MGLSKADIPSVLTAAGTAIAYADAYAAYALYGFIGPAAAFVLLGPSPLGTLAASLCMDRRWRASASSAPSSRPLIVSTEQPNYWALYLYLAVVTAAAFALARARLWRWLAVTALAASVLWALPGIGDLQALGPHAFHIAAGFVLAVLLIVSGLLFGPDAALRRDRSRLLRRACRLSLRLDAARARDRPRHARARALRRARRRHHRHCLAHRRGRRRRPGRRHPRHAGSSCIGRSTST